MRTLLATVVTLDALAVLANAAAGSPAPLPAFEVKTLQGQVAPGASLGPSGRWLLLYVTPGSPASTSLMSLVKQEQGDPTGRVVVIVGGSIAEAQAACAGTPGLARAAWYADPDRSALAALAVKGVPTAVGLRDRTMQWKMSGMPAEARTVRSILLSWLAE